MILPDTNLADRLTLERSFFFSLARTMLILPGVSGTVAMNWMCWPHVVAKCGRSQIEEEGHDDGECFARERCAEQREGLVRVEVCPNCPGVVGGSAIAFVPGGRPRRR